MEAQVNGTKYEYTYDNIGNRLQAVEEDEIIVYDTNELNQYTSISENDASAFVPRFDDDGNQTLIKTSTGIWSVVYNAENRPVSFTNSESNTVVECAYDSQGRRAYKKVTVNGTVTLHQRYIYRGYLQIACIDLTRGLHPALWFITWDPSQPVATRPLAIQISGTWHTYGWDLTKNICELYGTTGYISTTYTYTLFGQVTASGSVTQPIQWSSEIWDNGLGMVYYNWRYYNALYGVWNSKDYVTIANLYNTKNLIYTFDVLGLAPNINLRGNNKFIKLKSKTMTEYDFMQEYINEPEYFIIAAHCSEEGVYNPSTNMHLSPQELANMILENGYNYDKPIRIYACEMGRDTSPSGYLSMLANELSKRKTCSYKKGIYIEGPKELWYTTYDEDLKETLHYTKNGEIKMTTEIVFNENNELEVKIELDYISNMHKVYID